MTFKTCLVALIGLPGAGKTNFTELMCKCAYFDFYNLFIVHYDVLMVEESFKDDSFREFRKKVLKYVRTLTENISNGENFYQFCDVLYRDKLYPNLIILDDNFFYYSMRYEIYQLAGNFNSSFAEIYFDCTPDISVVVNSKRLPDHRVSEKTIVDMNSKLEKPDSIKNSWEKFYIIMTFTNDDSVQLLKVFNLIETSLKCPVTKSNFMKREVTHSLIHMIDILLRKKVNMLIKEIIRTVQDSETRDHKILQVHNYKSKFIDEIKTGKIVLHQHDIKVQLEMLFDSNNLLSL